MGACVSAQKNHSQEAKPADDSEYVEDFVVSGSRAPRVELAQPTQPTTPAPGVDKPPPPPPPPLTVAEPPPAKGKKSEKKPEEKRRPVIVDRSMPKADPREKPPEVEAPSDEAVEGGVEGGVVGGVAGGVVGGIEGQTGTESGNAFTHLEANPFIAVDQDHLSTFAVDVDTASYTLARRYIGQGALPPPDAVRVEEYVNYFRYRYAPPIAGAFSVSLEGAPSPFTKGHHVLRVGLQGKIVSKSERKPANLVFLMDTSGSMDPPDRLPLAREAVKMAVRNLNENDTVAIVTYAGGVADVLPPTPAGQQQKIFAAVDSLRAGGGTAMGSGMELAYKHAVQRAKAGVVSRVIVMTDGDTNIGPYMSADAMLEAVGKYVKEGVTLTTVGFGMGNYHDALMEKLADKGNGNCFYVDGPKEAQRVFVERLAGTLEVIAKDVKVQVDFNPKAVKTYRLLGYENRDIRDRDFRDDKVDAGEIGAGHTVTAMYEVQLAPNAPAQETLATVRIRAKEPFGSQAFEQAFPFGRDKLRGAVADASPDFRFAVAVAGTADILRHSRQSEGWSLSAALNLAQGAQDGMADRKEFVDLLYRARELWTRAHPVAER